MALPIYTLDDADTLFSQALYVDNGVMEEYYIRYHDYFQNILSGGKWASGTQIHYELSQDIETGWLSPQDFGYKWLQKHETKIFYQCFVGMILYIQKQKTEIEMWYLQRLEGYLEQIQYKYDEKIKKDKKLKNHYY